MDNKNLSFEILCATMHQKDFSKIKSMNIRSDVVFANQADENVYQEFDFEDHKAKMITTKTRGVGLNRNIALLASSKDIVLFADDDTFFCDDIEKNILEAFELYSDADVICFGSEFSKNGKVFKTRIPHRGKLPFLKSLKFGTIAIAARRKSLLKSNIVFTQLFGGGCIYSHGEDSDFIIQCYKNKLKIYSYDYVLGCTSKDESTCNFGYNEKYFYDTGALAKFAFGKLSIPYMLYMALRVKEDCMLSFFQKIRFLKLGYKNFDKLIPFSNEMC